MASEKSLTSYDHVAGFYDAMSEVYSLGQIKAAKLDQLHYLNAGDRALFVGCGAGLDVLAAARHGCSVTAIDTSQKMLDKLQQRLDKESLNAKLICDQFQNVDDVDFDVVCANFFLNCFPQPKMVEVLDQLVPYVRSGGTLMIADVAPPSGNVLARTTNQIYLHGAMLPFWLMGMVHWHANHDYLKVLETAGLQVQAVTPFRMLRLGPIVFRNIVAKKP